MYVPCKKVSKVYILYMKKYITIPALLTVFILSPIVASAHRSGCHRWHSCPSDTGSYECGDLGYTSGCPSKETPAIKESAPVVKNKVEPVTEPVIKYVPVKERKVETVTATTSNISTTVQKQKSTVKKQAPQKSTKALKGKTVLMTQPKTFDELNNCAVVGNKSSMIYFLKGNSLIQKMNIKNKYCFINENDAKEAGYRKSKVD